MSIYLDATRSPEERAADLLAQMSLDEKIAQLGSFWVYEILDGLTFSPERAGRLMRHGIGQVTRLGGASNVRPHQAAALANTIQKYLLENTRLKIPAVIHEECCSGYMAFGATVFPQAIGIASTWEPELVAEMTAVIRQQMRSVGAHHALAPVLDVARDARWGRVEETFGEDPYLVARMGVAYVQGLQGADLNTGIIATGKHFVGYGIAEGGLNWAPAHIPPRELREVYLFPFEAAVREAGLASMMNGYHELDGVPCGSSRELLTDILRGEWGFDGTVVSDYFAVNMLLEYHRLARDKAHAAGLALEAGIDIELPGTDCYGDPLRSAVEAGDIREGLVDQAVKRALTQKFALGIFEQPYVDAGAVAFDTPEQRDLAYRLACKSVVLLKNEADTLPLAKAIRTLAVVGPNADSIRNLFGDYAYPAHIEGLLEMKESGVFGTPVPEGVESVADFIEARSILAAIRDSVSPDTEVLYAPGCGILDESRAGFSAAVEAARQADVAIVVVGDKAGITDDCSSGEARDRAEIGLPGVQAELVRAVYETGTPVVLVLVNGRPVALDWMAEAIPAIVECWFPAEEGARAVADVLFGDVNPGGKLPITFPRTSGQIPVYYGHKPSGGRSQWKVDYVSTSVKPLYPFGYGLSYTTFAYDNLRIEPQRAQAGETIRITADIRNTGARSGEEVVQLYTHSPSTSVTRPVKELKGFVRISLEPGETRSVIFDLPVDALGFYNSEMKYGIEPGSVEVMIGSSSEAIHLRGHFEIAGDAAPITRKVFFSTAQAQPGTE
jgi:beta-glucosidase